MEQSDELSPFAERVGRVLRARYGETRDDGVSAYMLSSDRLTEAQEVEQFVWAFRVTESLPIQPGSPGIGRIDPGGPPRLADTMRPKRFSKWGLGESLASAEINDLLIAYGYDLGISAEADGDADLTGLIDRGDLPAQADDHDAELPDLLTHGGRGWETVVALCQAPTEVLTDCFGMREDLLPFVHDMAVRNVARVAQEGSGFRLSKEFARTGRLLVNVGLLLRAVQQDIGPQLWEMLADERLEAARERWPTPLHTGAADADR